MNTTLQLTPHEAMELHEILHNEIIAAKKLQSFMNMVTDQELKTLMQNILQTKKTTLNAYQGFFSGTLQQ